MPEPLIQTRNLGREFRAEGLRVSALRDVTLEVDHGEFVAVIGPSGSGKSTLMHLLGLLDEPSSGSYRLAGKETRGLHPDARAELRRRDLGFVFQSYNLLARSTALENVALPLVYSGMPRRKRRDRAAEMLAFVGLEHRIDHWPSQLSGGEQQRVAIARALVNDPSLVLADEPTGALDTQTGQALMGLLGSLNQAGRTIVLVTHDAAIGDAARRTVSMQDGRLVSDEVTGRISGLATGTESGCGRRARP